MKFPFEGIESRKRAANRREALAPALWRRHGGRCHYCGRRTRMVWWLNQRGWPILRTSFETVTYRRGVNGPVITEAIATVDHVIDRADGGPTELHNLVLACVRCNDDKNRKKYVRSWITYQGD